MKKIAIAVDSQLRHELLKLCDEPRWDKEFAIRFLDSREEAGFDFVLKHDEGRITIEDCHEAQWRPLSFDLHTKDWLRRLAKTHQSKELLRDALGAKSGESWEVLDATAGFLKDASLLVEWGHRVWAYEKHPLIYFLLQKSIAQLREVWSHGERLQLIWGDSLSAPVLSQKDKWDVVYLDPIYPAPKKAALNSKEMRLLKKIVGEQSEEGLESMLLKALSLARKRVILKRPLRAGTMSIGRLRPRVCAGKSVRYDVYDAASLGVSPPKATQ